MPHSRRQVLLYALATSAPVLLAGCASKTPMIRAMPRPEEMPDYMSVFQYMGQARVNGQSVNLETRIGSGDLIETGADSQVVFVLEKDAFQLQPNTRIRLPEKMLGGTYSLEAGAVLSVFASRRINISTPDAVIGIRGTGVYAEVQDARSYICNCYGETLITSRSDASQSINIISKHHDAPKYVYGRAGETGRIESAPFLNHADKELSMIETLVGREMPEE